MNDNLDSIDNKNFPAKTLSKVIEGKIRRHIGSSVKDVPENIERNQGICRSSCCESLPKRNDDYDLGQHESEKSQYEKEKMKDLLKTIMTSQKDRTAATIHTTSHYIEKKESQKISIQVNWDEELVVFSTPVFKRPNENTLSDRGNQSRVTRDGMYSLMHRMMRHNVFLNALQNEEQIDHRIHCFIKCVDGRIFILFSSFHLNLLSCESKSMDALESFATTAGSIRNDFATLRKSAPKNDKSMTVFKKHSESLWMK